VAPKTGDVAPKQLDVGQNRCPCGVGGLKTDVGESKRMWMGSRHRNRVGGNSDGRSVEHAYDYSYACSNSLGPPPFVVWS